MSGACFYEVIEWSDKGLSLAQTPPGKRGGLFLYAAAGASRNARKVALGDSFDICDNYETMRFDNAREIATVKQVIHNARRACQSFSMRARPDKGIAKMMKFQSKIDLPQEQKDQNPS